MMFGFQWNALRVGDRVMVHDDLDLDLELHEGAVNVVRTREREANEIGIRLDDSPAGIVRPRRHAVHLVPIDPRSPCWRCEVRAGGVMHAEQQPVIA